AIIAFVVMWIIRKLRGSRPQEPAPPPSAPALPFVYLGMLNPEAAKPQVFISSGDRLLIVSPGDVIDGVYRFESIAATEARFTYLPLNQRQVMSVQGEGN
ncbi:hypothetical protein ACQCSJ_21580, partial [Ralstonia pseudosolanacearum]